MHTIETRAATEAERSAVQGRRSISMGYGCLAIVSLACLLTGAALGRRAGANQGGYVAIGAFGAALLLVLAGSRPYARRRRAQALRDIEAARVQEIRVKNARVIEIGLINDNEPILAFDVGAGKILFLQGQWLRDPKTYGAPDLRGDPFEGAVNGLPAPHSFPSDAFTLTRMEHLGSVLGIRVEGAYVDPGPAVEALRPEFTFGDVELFEGSLDAMAAVLLDEHSRRKTRRSDAQRA